MNKPIPDLLTSYLEPGDPQYKIATDINDYFGWQFITPMAVSYWINSTYLPDIKTVKTILRVIPKNTRLWELFDSILKELEHEPVQS